MAEWVGAYAIPGKPFIIWAMMLTILPPCSFIQAWYTGREREREERREGGHFTTFPCECLQCSMDC